MSISRLPFVGTIVRVLVTIGALVPPALLCWLLGGKIIGVLRSGEFQLTPLFIQLAFLSLSVVLSLALIVFVVFWGRQVRWVRVFLLVALSVAVGDIAILSALYYKDRLWFEQNVVVAFLYDGVRYKDVPPERLAVAEIAFRDVLGPRAVQRPTLHGMAVDTNGILRAEVTARGRIVAGISDLGGPGCLPACGNAWEIIVCTYPTLPECYGTNAKVGAVSVSLDRQITRLLESGPAQSLSPVLIVYGETELSLREALACKQLAEARGLASLLLSLPGDARASAYGEAIRVGKQCRSVLLLLQDTEATLFCSRFLSDADDYHGVALLPSRLVVTDLLAMLSRRNVKWRAAVGAHLYSAKARELKQRLKRDVTPRDANTYVAAALVADCLRSGDVFGLADRAFARHASNEVLRAWDLDPLEFSKANHAIIDARIIDEPLDMNR
ncbi:MAG TPA: hypothetical protein VM238_13825 [Phycisphaerae bacterium]|nr:hypothetical protein [Phycisphaerae bacterium]